MPFLLHAPRRLIMMPNDDWFSRSLREHERAWMIFGVVGVTVATVFSLWVYWQIVEGLVRFFK
jgi:hypothetical protein